MERIFVQERDFTPGIILDKKEGQFEISGKACPENMEEFYGPIFKWIDEYIKNPNKTTVFTVNLNYYNTASSKALLKMLQKLEKLHIEGNIVQINWVYEAEDEELLIAGEDYAELIKIPFKFVEKK